LDVGATALKSCVELGRVIKMGKACYRLNPKLLGLKFRNIYPEDEEEEEKGKTMRVEVEEDEEEEIEEVESGYVSVNGGAHNEEDEEDD
jgi:hypothetical protein